MVLITKKDNVTIVTVIVAINASVIMINTITIATVNKQLRTIRFLELPRQYLQSRAFWEEAMQSKPFVLSVPLVQLEVTGRQQLRTSCSVTSVPSFTQSLTPRATSSCSVAPGLPTLCSLSAGRGFPRTLSFIISWFRLEMSQESAAAVATEATALLVCPCESVLCGLVYQVTNQSQSLREVGVHASRALFGKRSFKKF